MNHFADTAYIDIHKRRRGKVVKQKKENRPAADELGEETGNAEYNAAEETWHKRPIPTATKDPKVGQLEQSPVVPLCETPDPKDKKQKRKSRKITRYVISKAE